MREIPISRKSLVVLTGIVLVTVLGIWLIDSLVIHPSTVKPTPAIEEDAASLAVITGVEAFFDINYQEGKSAWLEGVCAVSSEGGCAYLASGADLLWKRFEDFQTVTRGTAVLEEQIRSGETEQVWRVSVTLSQPLPGSEKTQDEAYVLVVRVGETWLFDRFLLTEEIEAIQQNSREESSK
ncbi:MAG: hypothetical protein CVU39_07440 [Chloroflexi bacterium HGW-Chloroflexi-10]|nr:MAG: hypothetical protein CVU39_07440 [Chloroflexi bacterium HGW-Chloroflexi-10]